MSVQSSRPGRSITRTLSTPTAQRVTSRFTDRGRVRSSSVDLKAGAKAAAQVPNDHCQKDKCHEKQHQKEVAQCSGSSAGTFDARFGRCRAGQLGDAHEDSSEKT